MEPTTQHLMEKALSLRRSALASIHCAGSGHCGGSLSCAEIMSVLYFGKLRIDPGNPADEDRDRFVASKGHCAPILYAALAQRGFFPEEEMRNLRQAGHFLQGHPDMKKTPGVDMSTGSLGMGLSVGIGMALAARLQGKPFRVFVLMGDGEMQEGQVWEAAMAAVKFGLTNLVAILDCNGVQLDGPVGTIMPLGDITAKWQAFGWNVLEADGHDVEALCSAVDSAIESDGPAIVIAKTVKGKGVSFMEGKHEWHGRPLDADEYRAAVVELESAW